MKLFLPTLFLFILIGNSKINAQVKCDTIVVSANGTTDYDATIWTLEPTTNAGLDPNFLFERWTSLGTELTIRALIKFPMPILPPFSTVTNATLDFYYNPTTGHSQGNSYYPGSPYLLSNDGAIFRVSQNWNPLTVTWNSQPSYSMLDSVLIPPSTSKTQDLHINVTPLVQDMYLFPSTSDGFIFKMNTEAIYRSQVYSSSNNANIALHPKLIICYSLAPESIEEQNALNSINLSFNSNSGDITINNKNRKEINSISLYDLTGKKLFSHTIDNNFELNTISVNSSYSTGLYFLELTTSVGNIKKKVLIN